MVNVADKTPADVFASPVVTDVGIEKTAERTAAA
jgi:hypothetical protein